jgi:putative transposase
MKQYKDRQSIRLQGYDYSQDGWYFITICVNGFQEFFGEIVEGNFIKSKWGEIVENCWNETVELREGEVSIDVFQVMPNHFHGIIVIGDKKKLPKVIGFPDTTSEKETFKSPSKTIGAIIRGFKASVTSKIQKLENVDDLKLWQRNFYERIIRDEQELYRIQNYIRQNPEKWQKDKEFFKILLERMVTR